MIPSNSPTARIIMRTDLLSKRLFTAGCFGLPWMWIVHVLYWRGNQGESNQGLINPDDRTYSRDRLSEPNDQRPVGCSSTLLAASRSIYVRVERLF